MQTANRPRRQHVIPEMYQLPFANRSRQLCIYQRGKNPRWSSIRNTAVERDYHEWTVGTTRSDFTLEKTLANLESRAAAARRKLIARCHSKDDIAAWALFVAALFLKTRKVRNQMSSRLALQVASEFRSTYGLREIQQEFLKRGTLIPISVVENQLNHHLRRILASKPFLHFSGFHASVPNLAHCICQKSWHLVNAEAGCFFVTSDCPVTTAEIREKKLYLGYGFGLPNATIFVPIDPEHLFIAAPLTSQWASTLNTEDVEMINVMTIRFAEHEVYANTESEYVRRLVDGNINQIIYGKDAFVSKHDLPTS